MLNALLMIGGIGLTSQKAMANFVAALLRSCFTWYLLMPWMVRHKKLGIENGQYVGISRLPELKMEDSS